MKFLSLLILSAAGTALARGRDDDDAKGQRYRNSTGPASTKSQCRQIARLTELAASDPAKLTDGDVNRLNLTTPAAVAAAAASSQLATLQSNATLVAVCSQILAADAMEDACSTIRKLEKLQGLVANPAALDEKADGDAAKADELRAKAAEGAAELAALQANATLAQFCAVENTRRDCRKMRKLSKKVDKVANVTTAGDLEAKFEGDQEKMDKFLAKAEEAKTELAQMMGNATLVGICEELDAQEKGNDGEADLEGEGGGGGGAGEASEEEDVVIAGAGGLYQPLGTMIASLAGVALFGLLVL